MGPGMGKLQAPGLSLAKPRILSEGTRNNKAFNHKRHRLRDKSSQRLGTQGPTGD